MTHAAERPIVPADDTLPRSRRRYRHLPEQISLLVLDGAGFGAGMRLGYEVYLRTVRPDPVWSPVPPFSAFAGVVVVQVAVMVGVFFFARLYHQPRSVSRVDLVAGVFKAVTIGAVITYAFTSFLIPEFDFSRRIIVLDWLLTCALVAVLRLASRAVWAAVRRAGVGRDRLLIVGAGPTGQDLAARVQRRPWLGYEVVGFVDDAERTPRARGVPVVGRTADLSALVDELDADEVLIAMPDATRRELVTLVGACQHEGVSIRVFPDIFQLLAGEVQIGDLDGLPLLSMRDVALRGWRLTLKRLLDSAIAAAVLVLMAPVMAAIVVIVMIDSRGPVFFVQERVGLDGRRFPMLKFRSMRVGAEAKTGAVWAVRDDPRTTRVGALLRRSSLDELPQFINVLLGHMSIVGPRPERPEFVAQFRAAVPRYNERHQERAGITGWAQVNGLRGDTSIEERTKYDLYYVENWSLLLDLKIMAKTLLSLVKDPNAY